MNGGVLVPGAEGRTLRLRPAAAGEGVQLGIVGKRGSLVEALSVDLANVPALIFGIDSASELAWEEAQSARPRDRLPWEVAEPHERRLAAATAEREATHCAEGHELTPENSFQKRPGVKGCRRCRKNGNVWQRKARTR